VESTGLCKYNIYPSCVKCPSLLSTDPESFKLTYISYRLRVLDQSNDDINSITAETLLTSIPHQFKISDQDIQKIADAVKANIMTDITNLVLSHTQPLGEEIDKLKYENVIYQLDEI
jgi:hypothetical protein